MDFLKSIVQIITHRKISKVEILDKNLISSKDSLLTQLYEGLVDDSFNTDVEAVQFLYGDTSDVSVKNFRQLKARFKKRLLNTLFFIDINNREYETDVQKSYFECIRSLQEINIIQKYGGNQQIVYEIITNNYNTALKYEFCDVLKQYNYNLIAYYSLKGNIAKHAECIENFHQYRNIQRNIEDAYILFSTINCYEGSTKTLSEEKIQQFQMRLDMIKPNSDSYLAKCYIYLSQLSIYESQHENKKLSLLADEFILHLDTQDNAFRQSFKGVANMYKISTLLQLREYEKGLEYIDKNIHNLFGINWFEAMETKFKFAINLHNIELSESIIKEVCSNKSFNKLSPNISEKWYIYESYTIFYSSYLNDKKYKFNLGKFINQVPYYFHDKSGYNLSIIILQILFHLARNNRDEVLLLINSLRIYKTRYLKDDKQVRSIEFLKALFYLENSQLNKKKGNAMLAMFEQHVPSNAYIFNHEIIAYETLLNIISDLL